MNEEPMGNSHQSDILECEPQSIDFGSLDVGKSASALIRIHRLPNRPLVHSDQIKLTITPFANEGGVIEITLLPGACGELIWDELVLQTDAMECRVPITARWVEKAAETTLEQAVEPGIAPVHKPGPKPEEERTFKGQSCSFCGKNFAYNVDSGSWEKCTCSWYQKVWNVSLRTCEELYHGLKEIPSYLQELWRLILGKDKW